MDITIGLDDLNCVPIPEIGIRSKIVPDELSTMPAQSIFLSLAETGSGGIDCGGSRKYRRTATNMASGEMNQKVARHVAFRVKAAATKGPMVFPRPTHEPRIP